jgi:hypothetical protein
MHAQPPGETHQLTLDQFDEYQFERVMAWDTHRPTWRKLTSKVTFHRGTPSVEFFIYIMVPSEPGTVKLHFQTSDLMTAIDVYNEILLREVRIRRRTFMADR